MVEKGIGRDVFYSYLESTFSRFFYFVCLYYSVHTYERGKV